MPRVSTDARQRELFPLPVSEKDSISISNFDHIKLSKNQRRRVGVKCKIQQWSAAGINSLNEISGAPYSNPGFEVRNAAQAVALDHIQSEYAKVPKPPPELSPARAFAELCKTSSRYEPLPRDGAAGVRSPYDFGRVSWPQIDSSPHCILRSLDGADKDVMQRWRSSILKDCQSRDCYTK